MSSAYRKSRGETMSPAVSQGRLLRGFCCSPFAFVPWLSAQNLGCGDDDDDDDEGDDDGDGGGGGY